MTEEMVFVTVALHELESILQELDQTVLLDHGTTDRQGLGYLACQCDSDGKGRISGDVSATALT